MPPRPQTPTFYLDGQHTLLCRECAEDEGLYGLLGIAPAPNSPGAASMFPEYRGGEAACGGCGSDRLLLAYGPVNDEFLVCVACHRWRQPLREWDEEAGAFHDDDGECGAPQLLEVTGGGEGDLDGLSAVWREVGRPTTTTAGTALSGAGADVEAGVG